MATNIISFHIHVIDNMGSGAHLWRVATKPFELESMAFGVPDSTRLIFFQHIDLGVKDSDKQFLPYQIQDRMHCNEIYNFPLNIYYFCFY